jgi:hypothetical protein
MGIGETFVASVAYNNKTRESAKKEISLRLIFHSTWGKTSRELFAHWRLFVQRQTTQIEIHLRPQVRVMTLLTSSLIISEAYPIAT